MRQLDADCGAVIRHPDDHANQHWHSGVSCAAAQPHCDTDADGDANLRTRHCDDISVRHPNGHDLPTGDPGNALI